MSVAGTSTISGVIIGLIAGTASTNVTIGSSGNGNTVTVKQTPSGTGTSNYTGAVTFISAAVAHGICKIEYNNLNTTGLSLRTTGNTFGINHSGAFTTSFSCSYNNINIDRVGTSGDFYGTNCTASSSIIDYNISHNNITLNSSSSGNTAGIFNTNGGQPRNINNNLISVTGTGSAVYGMNITGGTISNVFDNTISNLNGGGAVFGIYFGAGSSPGHIYRNNIYNLTSSSATSNCLWSPHYCW